MPEASTLAVQEPHGSSGYQGHAGTPHSSHQTLWASLSILTAVTYGRPQHSWALSREGPTCPAEPQSPGGQTASGPKQGTSDRSQTTEDKWEEGQG